MKMFQFLSPFAAAVMLGVFAAGCESLPREEPIPVDITLTQLMEKMKAAMDPSGNYARATSYIQKQMVRTDRFLEDPEEEMIEVQFEKPGRFRLTTYRDMRPENAWIVNGNSGWIVNYRRKKVDRLDGAALAQLKALTLLATPDSALDKVFSKIDLSGSRIDDVDYYKLTCANAGQDWRVILYVGQKDFLIRRITIDGQVRSTSVIQSYKLNDGVMIPAETVTSGGQTSRTIFYQLDVKIPITEFMEPRF